MSDYRRWFVPGAMVFLTIVTCGRRRILTSPVGRHLLRQAISAVRETRPFDLFATVLLPDHWHLIMELPHGDADYSWRIKRIKEDFTKTWLRAGLSESAVTESQNRKGERGIWQPRFWEHTIQDAGDLESHTDYIHWNPRKHELVTRIRDWEYSSFHRFVQAGDYDINWGGNQPRSLDRPKEWGEP